MRRRLRAVLLVPVFAAGALTIGAAALQQQATAVQGTALLRGTLVADDAAARPVNRATIRLTNTENGSVRLIGTDEDGHFSFSALPTGAYTVSATKAGFVTTFHGSKRAGRGPGVPVAVPDAATVQVALKILPGAAITGLITDARGNPARGITVLVVDVSASPISAVPAQATTDDRGVYRIFGLPPASYLVAAVPKLTPRSQGRVMGSGNAIAVTDAEVQWALRSGASVPASAQAAGRSAAPPPGRVAAYAPVYFPGTTDVGAAQSLIVTTGEERTGADLSIRPVTMATIGGTIVDGDGQPVTLATVSLSLRSLDQMTLADRLVAAGALALPRGSVSAGGFSIPGVAPGDYTIIARSGSGLRVLAAGPAPADPLWAVADVTVDGSDRSDLTLRLLPGLKLSGSMVFEGSTSAPPRDFSVVDLVLVPSSVSATSVTTRRAVVDPAGAFSFSSIPPGAYTLAVSVPGGPGAGPWVLKSAIVRGRDLADVPFDVTTSGEQIQGAVITFTDRPTRIDGRLLDAGGVPVTRYTIAAIAVDRSYWRPSSRRIRLVRPATDGSFIIAGLPPGQYAIAAVEDLEASDLADPAVLSSLVGSGFTLTVAEGERRRQDVRVRGTQ